MSWQTAWILHHIVRTAACRPDNLPTLCTAAGSSARRKVVISTRSTSRARVLSNAVKRRNASFGYIKSPMIDQLLPSICASSMDGLTDMRPIRRSLPPRRNAFNGVSVLFASEVFRVSTARSDRGRQNPSDPTRSHAHNPRREGRGPSRMAAGTMERRTRTWRLNSAGAVQISPKCAHRRHSVEIVQPHDTDQSCSRCGPLGTRRGKDFAEACGQKADTDRNAADTSVGDVRNASWRSLLLPSKRNDDGLPRAVGKFTESRLEKTTKGG
jgi:Putative transposase DNA-binding domain